MRYLEGIFATPFWGNFSLFKAYLIFVLGRFSVRLSVNSRYFLGQVLGREWPFCPSLSLTRPLKISFPLQLWRCFALFLDCYGVDRGLTMD
jgi:hypothetical protein